MRSDQAHHRLVRSTKLPHWASSTITRPAGERRLAAMFGPYDPDLLVGRIERESLQRTRHREVALDQRCRPP